MGGTDRRQQIATTARVIGVLAAAMWLLPLVGGLIGGDSGGDGMIAESIGVGLLAGANVVAVVVAFRRPVLGGRMLLATGTLFSVFASITAVGTSGWRLGSAVRRFC
jgi:hypothetical protein